MIIVTEIDQLIEWLQENRADKESGKPYFIPIEVEGGYELPNDSLIRVGLDELSMPFKIVHMIEGISIEIDSQDL